jgi:hypothetical protein
MASALNWMVFGFIVRAIGTRNVRTGFAAEPR